MNLLASVQSPGIAKGFGTGLAVVLLAYSGLYGWTSSAGPNARTARDAQLVSSTVVIERVLPINPPIQKPVVEATPAPLAHTEPVQVAEVPHEETTAGATESAHVEPTPTAPLAESPHAEEAHPSAETPVTPMPAPVAETPAPVQVPEKEPEDNLLKDIQKYPNGMCMAPVDGLYEDTTVGRLPVLRNDGLSAFKVYRKPFASDGNTPVISIAVMDMGLSAKITESSIKSLPAEVSLIVSPYADGPDMWVSEARSGGHEVWLTLPLESSTYPKTDPGPHTLLVGAPERENQQKLDWIMGRAVGYTGLVATYQPVFMSSQNDVRPILGSIYKRGIGFMDSGNMAGTLPETMAISMNAPYSNIDVWIDKPENTPEIINASLLQLEVIAKENGFAAGVISPSAISFREVQAWIETLKAKGIVLAPLSAQTGY